MKETSFYKYLTLLLLVLNITIISFFIITKPKGPKGPKGSHPQKGLNAVKHLNLDEKQTVAFESLRQAHQKSITELNEEHKHLLSIYFDQSFSESEKTKTDSILNAISLVDLQKIIFTKAHFEEVRSFLREDQEDYYRAFVDQAMSMILGKQPQPRRPGN